MADRRAQERAGRGGWLATLALGVIGVATGFATGIIVGISWEEPALVLGYLTGETEKIDWSLTSSATGSEEAVADRALESLPAIAAPPPSAVGTPRAKEAPDPAAPPVARDPVSGGGYSVQVGAFSDSQAAHALADSLRDQGYRVYLSRAEGEGATWRVRVGPLKTRADAERTARRLESRENLRTWVIGESS